MKKILVFALFGILSTAALFADDFLSRVTGGNLSDNSKGVISLNDDEMKKVVGGYIFIRMPMLDNYGPAYSYSFIVSNGDENTISITENDIFAVAQSFGYNNELIVAKIRFINGKKEYYLTRYSNDGLLLGSVWSNPSIADRILNEFRNKY